jgi:hypothetical protein
MPLFSPRKGRSLITTDATEDFQDLTLFKSEGYDSVSISGKTMNVQTDFKVWCGILLAFYKYGYNTDTVSLQFTEFAKFCGYKSKRLDLPLRQSIDEALGRLAGQTIHFKTKNAKRSKVTSLLLKSSLDFDNDKVSLTADSELWELYTIDHQILVSINVLQKLPRSETSQCLYLYLASLPKSPIPVTLVRMRDRVRLSMPIKECNRSIKQAIANLEKIGYLKGEWITWHGETAYQITNRDKTLLPSGILD